MNPLSPSGILPLLSRGRGCARSRRAGRRTRAAGRRRRRRHARPVRLGCRNRRQAWDNPLGQYGWGASAILAKQQTRAALAAKADNDFLAQYGWGAAATYAKLHG